MYSISILYFPGKTSILKLPSISVIPPWILFGNFKFDKEIVAYSRGCPVSLSTTNPFKFCFWKPVFDGLCAFEKQITPKSNRKLITLFIDFNMSV